jgi:cytochrome P450
MNAQPLMPEVDFAADLMPDLEDRLATLGENGRRIAPIKWKGETAWVVLRYQDVYKGMSDDDYIPAFPEYRRNWDTQGAQPLKDHGAEHRASRGLLEQPFKIGKVRGMVESMLLPLADRLIDDFGSDREIDFVNRYTRRYTFMVMATLLGIPVDPANEEQLITLVYALLQGGHIVGDDTPENRRKASLQAVAELNDFLRPIVEARRKAPQDDIISYLLASELNGGPVAEEVLYDYIRFLFPAGAETTHLAMGRMMKNVLTTPGLRDRLIANPKDRAAVVDETLRFTPAANLVPRTLVRDTEVCEVTVPAGSTLLFSVTSGNRDPEAFPNPESFDIDQKRKPLLSFGMGPHFCLGSHLAKAELVTSLGRLLERLPGLRIAEIPPPAVGSVFRWLPELKIAFDDILPPPAPAGA